MHCIFEHPFRFGYAINSPLLSGFCGGMMEQSFLEISMTLPHHFSFHNSLGTLPHLSHAAYPVRPCPAAKSLRIALSDILQSMQK